MFQPIHFMTRKNFFFFGDSICVGQFVSPHRSWVTVVAQKIEEEFGQILDIRVINSSVNGNTTRMALERMGYDVLSHGVDYILVQFGMNDCNYWQSDRGIPRVSKAAFSANLEEIIVRARKFGAKIVYLSTNHSTPRSEMFDHTPVSYQQSNEDYNCLIREVARSTSATLIDNEVAWNESIKGGASLRDLLLDDHIHLSVRGHDLYTKTVWPMIRDNLSHEIQL
jgi:acyl-CoA thioesterase I